MKKFLPLFLVLASPAFAQSSPLDGDWKGRSDGGSCNAPLDYLISIDTGIVDGTAVDATARGPVPNLKKRPRRPRRRPACGRSTASPRAAHSR